VPGPPGPEDTVVLDFLTWLFWTLALGGIALALAYRRVDLRTATATLGLSLLAYMALSGAWWWWSLLLAAAWCTLAALNFGELRREQVTAPLMRFYRTLVPHISDTEREALEAGTVWWDGELFTGLPDWSKLAALPAPRLTDAERAFLDGPTEELCRRANDWEITHELGDMPRALWDYIIEQRFFAMIIPKRYGGLEFSPLAVAMVLSAARWSPPPSACRTRSARRSCCSTTAPRRRRTTTCRAWRGARRSPASR
jgi:acyl-CoA dehydrogenase